MDEKETGRLLEEVLWLRKRNATLEKRLQEHEQESCQKIEFLQTLIDSLPIPVYYLDTQGIYLGCNKALERFISTTKEQLIGKTVFDLFPKEIALKYQQMDKTLIATSGKQVFESIYEKPDGEILNLLHIKATYNDANGNVAGLIGSFEDITEIKKTKLALENQKHFYENLLDNANVWLDAIDRQGNIILWNKKAEEITGLSSEEVLGNQSKWWRQYPDPIDRQKKLSFCLHLMDEEETCTDIEVEVTVAGGQKRIISWSSNLIRDKKGCVTGSMFVGLDITEQKRMQKELFRLDRLNLVGEIAASIGHEIRNPMTTVRGYLQFLQRKDALASFSDHFDTMIDELDRANSIITEFLSLAKNKIVDLEAKSLNSIVTALAPLIQAEAVMSDKVLELHLADIVPLLLDEKEIRQLLLNLCHNALEAMTAGQKLTISTAANAEYVILSVADQGPGIDPSIIEKLGTPFLTTKPNGTGLGLAVCYSIASRHHANITVETSPEGTTFTIQFPIGEK